MTVYRLTANCLFADPTGENGGVHGDWLFSRTGRAARLIKIPYTGRYSATDQFGATRRRIGRREIAWSSFAPEEAECFALRESPAKSVVK